MKKSRTIFQARLCRNGRLALPRELRERMRVREGMTLVLRELGNGVIVMIPLRAKRRASGR
jgi:bifunctional DNA-binding transcriptional regulator/antitoxin component of YhaV-PrlF toxin-antitoxin module